MGRRGIIGYDLGRAIAGVGSSGKGGRRTRKRRHVLGVGVPRWSGMTLPSGRIFAAGTRRRKGKLRRSIGL